MMQSLGYDPSDTELSDLLSELEHPYFFLDDFLLIMEKARILPRNKI